MPTTDTLRNSASLRQWCEAGSDLASVAADATIAQVVDQFRIRPDRRVLPVTDAAHRVIGAIFEEDIRAILFNPYGHALLQNPGISSRLDGLVKPCPMVDAAAPLAVALQAQAAAAHREGVILTDDGRLAGVLLTRTLVRLAAAEDAARLRAQAGRMARMATASARFEAEAAELAMLLAQMSRDIERASAMAADRAAGATHRTAVVAEAGRRGMAGIDQLAEDSGTLVAAFGQLHADTAQVHAVSIRAVETARYSSAQTARLTTAVRSIEAMLTLIQTLAKRLNLLSLNATIEAARAGAAGRGFTAVAGEVRALSGQTRKAADDIAGEIRDIRTVMADVTQSQDAVRAVVTSVDGLVDTVDAAIFVQQAMTGRIADSAGTARDAARSMADLLEMVDDDARTMLAGADGMETLAQTLSANAARFGTVVNGFVLDMQTA